MTDATAPKLTDLSMTIDGLTATLRPIGNDTYEVTIAGKVRGTIGKQGADAWYPGQWYTQHINIGENLELGEDCDLAGAVEDFLLVYVCEPDLLTYA